MKKLFAHSTRSRKRPLALPASLLASSLGRERTKRPPDIDEDLRLYGGMSQEAADHMSSYHGLRNQ